MPSRPNRAGAAQPTQAPRRVYRRRAGELTTPDFLRAVLEQVRDRLPNGLRGLHARDQGSLIKVFAEEELIHFELWLHHSRGRVELGLHFETGDAARNQCLLGYVADDLPFFKEILGQGLEAEPWDKGWTRLYISYPLERLGAAEAARLADAFGGFIETLEPVRQEACKACPARPSARQHQQSGELTTDDYVDEVLQLVQRIPPGRVMSYGGIAAYLAERTGRRSPRLIGRIMAMYGDGVPWHRVVRSSGRVVASSDVEARARLRAEHTPMRDDNVDMRRAEWQPDADT